MGWGLDWLSWHFRLGGGCGILFVVVSGLLSVFVGLGVPSVVNWCGW